MRVSYALPHSNGTVYLPPEVRSQLQLGRSCRLYGRVVDDTAQPCAILSTLPVKEWGRAFRVMLHTSHSIGSLQKAVSEVSSAGLNIFHLWASATSAQGELAATIVVSLGSDTWPSEQLPDAERLESSLLQRLKEQGFLSQSRLYSGNAPSLKPVRVTRLKVLAALADISPSNDGSIKDWIGDASPEFESQLTDSRLELDKIYVSTSNGSPDVPLSRLLTTPVNRDGLSVLVTPDDEEWHCRLAILPREEYVQLRVPVNVESTTNEGLRGITNDLLRAVTDSPVRLNIYYAQSNTTSRILASGSKAASESIELRVSGEVSKFLPAGGRTLKDVIVEKTKLTLAASDQVHNGANRKAILHAQGLSITPMLAPFAFFATNVKAATPESIQLAIQLCGMLKELRFRPVFLNVINTAPDDARSHIAQILDVCPVLVSLHVPEVALKQESDGYAFAPSAWTIFEEAYMRSKGDRYIQRIIHSSVYPPPFLDGNYKLTYESCHEFSKHLITVRERLQEIKENAADWKGLVQRCMEPLVGKSELLRDLLSRDPEPWFEDQQRKAVEDGMKPVVPFDVACQVKTSRGVLQE